MDSSNNFISEVERRFDDFERGDKRKRDTGTRTQIEKELKIALRSTRMVRRTTERYRGGD